MENLNEIQKKHNQWARHNFPKTLPHQPLLGMHEELGELSHAHLKQEQGIRGTYVEHHSAKEDAVGDIVMYMLHYCALNDLNLEACIEVAWNEIKTRDWIEFPKNGKTE